MHFPKGNQAPAILNRKCLREAIFQVPIAQHPKVHNRPFNTIDHALFFHSSILLAQILYPIENTQPAPLHNPNRLNYKYDPFPSLHRAGKPSFYQFIEQDANNNAGFVQYYNKKEADHTRSNSSNRLNDLSPFPSLKPNTGFYGQSGKQTSDQTSNAYNLDKFRKTKLW
jgi:hypothetical protein